MDWLLAENIHGQRPRSLTRLEIIMADTTADTVKKTVETATDTVKKTVETATATVKASAEKAQATFHCT